MKWLDGWKDEQHEFHTNATLLSSVWPCAPPRDHKETDRQTDNPTTTTDNPRLDSPLSIWSILLPPPAVRATLTHGHVQYSIKNRDPSVDPPRLIANAIGRTTVFYRFVGASSNPTPPLPTHDCIVAQDQQQLSSINVTLLPNTHTLSGQTEDSTPTQN